jgi:hypothetical protein
METGRVASIRALDVSVAFTGPRTGFWTGR